jgi:hypothetical protein
MSLRQLSDANKARAEFDAEIKTLDGSSKALEDDALAALGDLDLAGPQLDSFLQGRNAFEEAYGSFKKALDHGQTIQRRCDHIKNGLASKGKEIMRMPRRTIPPPELVEESMSIILMAFGNLDEFRFDEKSRRIFFNQELEEEREEYDNLLKLHRGASGTITSREESLSKMITERDDLKAEVAARDGTIEDQEEEIRRLRCTIAARDQTIAGMQGTITARDQTISELRAEVVALQGAITEKGIDNVEEIDDMEVLIRLGRGERVFSWS